MHNITEVNSFDANVSVCDDGDAGAASSFQPTAQSLTNRTKNLNTRLTAAEATVAILSPLSAKCWCTLNLNSGSPIFYENHGFASAAIVAGNLQMVMSSALTVNHYGPLVNSGLALSWAYVQYVGGTMFDLSGWVGAVGQNLGTFNGVVIISVFGV